LKLQLHHADSQSLNKMGRTWGFIPLPVPRSWVCVCVLSLRNKKQLFQLRKGSFPETRIRIWN